MNDNEGSRHPRKTSIWSRWCKEMQLVLLQSFSDTVATLAAIEYLPIMLCLNLPLVVTNFGHSGHPTNNANIKKEMNKAIVFMRTVILI